jgi:hypothetical protein
MDVIGKEVKLSNAAESWSAGRRRSWKSISEQKLEVLGKPTWELPRCTAL